MEKITITEALSEINLIKKKIESKRKIVLGLLVSPEHMKDPYESVGGSEVFIKCEVQSIADLERRQINIRSAIAKANLDHEITVGEQTKSIHDWLTWKREIAQQAISFLNSIATSVKNELDQLTKLPKVYKNDKDETHLLRLKSNIDLPEINKSQERLNEMFETLDGKLSLRNATIIVNI